jgi:hypothetical protein
MPISNQDKLQETIPSLKVMRFAGDEVSMPPEVL